MISIIDYKENHFQARALCLNANSHLIYRFNIKKQILYIFKYYTLKNFCVKISIIYNHNNIHILNVNKTYLIKNLGS